VTHCFQQRVFWAIGILAIVLGGITFTPRLAVADWSVGEPIVTYWNWGETTNLTDSIAQQAVDGGYNLVWAGGVQNLALAQKYGLRAQMWLALDHLPPVGSPERTTLDAVIDWCRKSPAAYSYYLADEPNASRFAGLRDLVHYLHERDPDHLAYINLLSIYIPNSSLGTSGYDAYLDQYVSTVHPSLLSYDLYHLNSNNKDWSQYLQNLGLVSRKARQAGIPFMNVVQAGGWDASLRIPNADELRYTVYSTLAYGAQGICYFTYRSLTPNTGGLEPAADGTPTSIYTALTPLNKEFKNIAAQYQPLKLIGNYVKGYQAGSMPPGTTQLPSDSPFDINGVSNSMSYSDGDPLKGILFGFFDKDGATPADATVAVVVNLDYTAGKTYTLTGPRNLSIFDAATGVWTPTGQPSATLNLAPGGGVLVGPTSVVH
jgi:hypothetical protein